MRHDELPSYATSSVASILAGMLSDSHARRASLTIEQWLLVFQSYLMYPARVNLCSAGTIFQIEVGSESTPTNGVAVG